MEKTALSVERSPARPYWISAILLVVALLLSVAVGSVFIPPGVLLQVLFGRLFGGQVPAELTPAFATILFDLRLPRTLLVAHDRAQPFRAAARPTRACFAIRWPTPT